MYKINFLLFLFLSNLIFSQNNELTTIEKIINTKCVGSPTDRNAQRQDIKCRLFKNSLMELSCVTTEIATGKVLRTNYYTVFLNSLDTNKSLVKQFGNYYGLFLYSKGQEKTIKQTVLIEGDAGESIFQQDKLCISDFEDKSAAEELKKEFEKIIALAEKENK